MKRGAAMNNGFAVYFEIVTDESAEHGAAAETGTVETGLSLRDASALVDGPALCDSSPVLPGARVRWLVFFEHGNGSRREIEKGERETRTLAMPDGITAASSQRVARLFHAYGLRPRVADGAP